MISKLPTKFSSNKKTLGHMSASIVVPCKGRLHHLRQTLPTMLAQQCPFEFEVIVVDFACPQGTFQWCKSLDCKQLIAVRVDASLTELNLCQARNCGGVTARGKALAFVDADMRLASNWLAQAAPPIIDGRAGMTRAFFNVSNGWDRGGTCIVSRKLFHRTRGYDEGFPLCWGAEDAEFYARCQQFEHSMTYPSSLLAPLKHKHDERTKFFPTKSIYQGAAKRGQYIRGRQNQVNPNGYGGNIIEVFQGTGEAIPTCEWTRRYRVRRRLRTKTN